MVGLEALSMQGLPVDKLLLTRETEDNLADLAGNAMSTTVVGACILAALVSGKKLLKSGSDSETYESKHGHGTHEQAEVSHMDVDVADMPQSSNHVVGDEHLASRPLDLSITEEGSFSTLLHEAKKSQRLCSCEGRIDMTSRPLYRCQDCGSAFCKKCGGRPEHNPQPIDVVATPRVPPSEFARLLKSTLPMCLSLTNVTKELLDGLRAAEETTIPETRWSSWSTAVLRAASSELRFVELKRQEIWSVVYQSSTGTLELSLHPQQPEWRLYAVPEAHEPANAEIRKLLQAPVGRFTCNGNLLKGRWQFALPCFSSISVKIQGLGDQVPSWEARLGLIGDEFKNQVVYSKLKISVGPTDIQKLDRDISGIYDLLDKCGTANGALHKKAETDANLPPLFMLFDPHRTNDAEDCFVFSISTRRLEYQESRPIICKLDSSWRQTSKDSEQIVPCHLPFKWVSAHAVELTVSHFPQNYYADNSDDNSLSSSHLMGKTPCSQFRIKALTSQFQQKLVRAPTLYSRAKFLSEVRPVLSGPPTTGKQ